MALARRLHLGVEDRPSSDGLKQSKLAPPDNDALAKSEDYIDEHNETHLEDSASLVFSPAEAEIFGHVVPGTNGAWLQYWMFYYYNNGIEGVGDHEGDWEMVQVHLSKDSGYLRDQMAFSQHSWGVLCERGEYETEGADAPGFGGQPVVYVANGSHAAYPEEGLYSTEGPFADVNIFDPEQEEPITAQVQNLESEPNWLNWPGHWGGSESSPEGPKFHEMKWNEPQVWSEEAESCTFNKILPRAALRADGRSGGSPGLVLESARVRDGKLHVAYDATSILRSHPTAVRLIVSARSPQSSNPPEAVIVENVKRRGTVTLPVRINSGLNWQVRASAVTSDARIEAVPLLAGG